MKTNEHTIPILQVISKILLVFMMPEELNFSVKQVNLKMLALHTHMRVLKYKPTKQNQMLALQTTYERLLYQTKSDVSI